MFDRCTTRLFTVPEFYRIGEAGVFGSEERLELVDGVIYHMPGVSPGDAHAVDVLTAALTLALRDRAIVRARNPVHLGDMHEPRPAVAVVRRGCYRDRHPTPFDIHLIIEVHASIPRKLRLYAQVGVWS